MDLERGKELVARARKMAQGNEDRRWQDLMQAENDGYCGTATLRETVEALCQEIEALHTVHGEELAAAGEAGYAGAMQNLQNVQVLFPPDVEAAARVDPLLMEAEPWGRLRAWEDAGDSSVGIDSTSGVAFIPASHVFVLHADTAKSLGGLLLDLMLLEPLVRFVYGRALEDGCTCPACKALRIVDERRAKIEYGVIEEALYNALNLAKKKAGLTDIELVADRLWFFEQDPNDLLRHMNAVFPAGCFEPEPQEPAEKQDEAAKNKTGVLDVEVRKQKGELVLTDHDGRVIGSQRRMRYDDALGGGWAVIEVSFVVRTDAIFPGIEEIAAVEDDE